MAFSRKPFATAPFAAFRIPASGGGNLSVTPAAGSVSIAGQAPTADTAVAPGAGSVAFTGFAPGANATVAPGAGAVVFTGLAPAADTTAAPGVGGVVITGFAPTLPPANIIASPGVGSVVITGFAPDTVALLPAGGAADEARRKWLEWSRKRRKRVVEPARRPVAEAVSAVAPKIEAPQPVDPAIVADVLLAANLAAMREKAQRDAGIQATVSELVQDAMRAARDEDDAILLLLEGVG